MLATRAAGLDYVASPLKRACETMEILRAELGLTRGAYRTDARLLEIDYGSWEGAALARCRKPGRRRLCGPPSRHLDLATKGWRKLQDAGDRVGSWLAAVERDSVVVAHGGVSRALRALLGSLAPSEIMRLEVPQDRILQIQADRMRWL